MTVIRILWRHRALIAGGAVRDHLLGLEPHDVDVATSARPEELLALFPGSRHVGAAFGVVLVGAGTDAVEVATFRTEGPYLDGRRPTDRSGPGRSTAHGSRR